MAQQIQIRRGTATAWTNNNPLLASGEFGFETNTGKFKIGDGVNTWTALPYANSGSSAGALISSNNLSDLQSIAQAKLNLSLVKADVGLSNVDNTSDISKPVSGAQSTAIAAAVASSLQKTANLSDVASAQLSRVNINQGMTALTDAATINTNAALGNIFTVTLAGNRVLANPTNLLGGGTYQFIITQDATGSRTLTFGSVFKFPSGTAPTLTTGAAAVDIITATCVGTNLLCAFLGDVR